MCTRIYIYIYIYKYIYIYICYTIIPNCNSTCYMIVYDMLYVTLCRIMRLYGGLAAWRPGGLAAWSPSRLAACLSAFVLPGRICPCHQPPGFVPGGHWNRSRAEIPHPKFFARDDSPMRS